MKITILILIGTIYICCSKAQTFSACTNNRQLAFFASAITFEEAKASCAQSLNGTVARVDSPARFTEIQKFVFNLAGGVTLWVGQQDTTDAGGSLNPGRFDFVDGAGGSKAFYLAPGVFPWLLEEPNDLDSENCIEWPSMNLWNDIACTASHPYVCDFFCLPTASPTRSPTDSPTFSPTKSPSVSPSFSPTDSPTRTNDCRPAALGVQSALKVSVIQV